MEEMVESSRKLVLLYEKFYHEKPDFNEEDGKKKAMAMAYLLWEYSVYLPMATSFKLSEENPSKVWSNDVENLFHDSLVITENHPEWMLEESNLWSIQFADLIGTVVSYYLPFDVLEFMENVATLLFLRKHSLANVSLETTISSKYVSCNYDEILVILDLLDYLDVLRDYVCGIGSGAKYFGVVQNIEEEIDTIFENVELILKRKKKKESVK